MSGIWLAISRMISATPSVTIRRVRSEPRSTRKLVAKPSTAAARPDPTCSMRAGGIGALFAGGAGEQALRAHDQHHDHDRVDDEGAESRKVVFAGDVADADEERRQERAGDAGGAADRHHDQEIDHVFERK